MQVGVLTISDRASQGIYDDASGHLIRRFVEEQLHWQITTSAVLPDDRKAIAKQLRSWADEVGLNLILTTGGTGFSPRDLTPEATRDVIERETPGLAEAMRAAGLKKTPHAMLSRGVCGIRGRTLIVNLPGNPKAIFENLEVLAPVLSHALELLSESPSAESGHNSARRA